MPYNYPFKYFKEHGLTGPYPQSGEVARLADKVMKDRLAEFEGEAFRDRWF
jgi:hypothetical protein